MEIRQLDFVEIFKWIRRKDRVAAREELQMEESIDNGGGYETMHRRAHTYRLVTSAEP